MSTYFATTKVSQSRNRALIIRQGGELSYHLFNELLKYCIQQFQSNKLSQNVIIVMSWMYLHANEYTWMALLIRKTKALNHSCCIWALNAFAFTVFLTFFLTDVLITQFIVLSTVLSNENNMLLPGIIILALRISLIQDSFLCTLVMDETY